MATKILKVVQDIAHDQLTVYSTLQNLIDTYHVYSDEIKDYEVTPYGANQFLVSLVFLWLQQEGYTILFKLAATVNKQFKAVRTKTANLVAKTIRTDLFGFSRTIVADIAPVAVRNSIAGCKRSVSGIGILGTVLDYIFHDLDLQAAAFVLSMIGLSRLANLSSIENGSVALPCIRLAWYNTIPC